MEISLADLETTSGEYQAYWLIAVKAARNAFLVRRQRAQAASRRSLLTIPSIYPGLKALSRGSDCNAVWFCPRRIKTPICWLNDV
eukprot:scaffold5215_cov202-Skeletonema_menzelii.AAC.2